MNAQLLIRSIFTVTLASFFITAPLQAQSSVDSYMGAWALYLPDGAGWLNVHQDHGYLDAELLWYGGSVLPVSSVTFHEGTLTVTRVQDVVRQRDADQNPIRTHQLTHRFVFQIDSGYLKGKAYLQSRNGMEQNMVKFKGKAIPPVPATPDLSTVKYGEPVNLIQQNSMDGWSMVNPDRANGFSVQDGVLSNNPEQVEGEPYKRFGNLRTDQTFEDFNLKLQVNVPEGNNSGIYLRGIYEVQVFDSYGKPLDPHNMGAIYSRITPSVAAEKPAGQWQDLDITLYKRHATVILNGKTIIDNQPVLGVTGGALTADQFSPGPICPQPDQGHVHNLSCDLTRVGN